MDASVRLRTGQWSVTHQTHLSRPHCLDARLGRVCKAKNRSVVSNIPDSPYVLLEAFCLRSTLRLFTSHVPIVLRLGLDAPVKLGAGQQVSIAVGRKLSVKEQEMGAEGIYTRGADSEAGIPMSTVVSRG